MLNAYHPTKNIFISYKEYNQYTLTQDVQIRSDAPLPRCPVCNDVMRTAAGKKKDDGHFRHQRGVFCPTKASAADLYERLKPSDVNNDLAQANKDFVYKNMSSIWYRLYELVPFLDKKEFLKILVKAKELNIYSYVDLDPAFIVYVYLNLINFLPRTSFKRRRLYKFLYFFETNSSNEKLWINRGKPSKLIRLTSKDNKFIKSVEIETTSDYLNNKKQLSKDDLDNFLKAI